VRICDGQTLIYVALFSRARSLTQAFFDCEFITEEMIGKDKKPFQSELGAELEWKISNFLSLWVYIPAGFLADYIRHCPLAMQCA
jgi:hypothetical protein